MYFGPASMTAEYFARLGYPCPDTFNPSDYFLDLIALDQRSPERNKASSSRIEFLASKYSQHSQRNPLPALKHAPTANSEETAKSLKRSKRVPFEASWVTQYYLLSQRALRVLVRNHINNIIRLCLTLIFALLIGCIWYNEGEKLGGASVNAVVGGLFFLLVNMAFSSMYGIIFIFPAERNIVLTERAARSYQTGAYFWSKSIAELPRVCGLQLIFCAIVYSMMNLRNGAEYFFIFYLIGVLSTMASESIAMAVSAVAPNSQVAGSIAPVFM